MIVWTETPQCQRSILENSSSLIPIPWPDNSEAFFIFYFCRVTTCNNYVYDDEEKDKEEEMRDKVKIRSNLPF